MHNVAVFNTLTGFKYIGEKINQFVSAKFAGDIKKSFDYIIGYEESYGYLVGNHARDKDAVVSAMLISEMCAQLKKNGKTLVDRLNELYNEYGYFLDCQDSFILQGKDGLERIKNMMRKLRVSGELFAGTSKIVDYIVPIKAEFGFGDLPVADVIVYEFLDGSWVAVRPSGTEPKIKIYYSIKGNSEELAKQRQAELHKIIIDKLGL